MSTKPDHWTLARVELADAAFAEDGLLAASLADLGLLGLVQDEQAPHVWTAYFDAAAHSVPEALGSPIRDAVAAMGGTVVTLQLTDAPSENWQDNWRQYFRPIQVTPRIRVAPPWEPEPAAPGTIDIRIEPGMAFGTGTHETTQLCIQLAEGVLRPGAEVLDIGTGSSILCIAAIRLGAAHAVGVDNDSDILDNSRENMALNAVDDGSIEIRVGVLSDISRRPFDVVFCNMLSREFLPILPDLPGYLATDGSLILSGFLLSEESEVRSALAAAGLDAGDVAVRGEWGGLVAHRASAD